MLMQVAGTLAPRMHQWVACTRLIANQLFTYPQVGEYGSCHFCTRHLEMRLRVVSASTQRRPSTKAKKGVKFLRLFKQALRYFRFFSNFAVSIHLSGVLDW